MLHAPSTLPARLDALRRPAAVLLVVALITSATSCVYHRVEVKSIDPKTTTVVTTPVKAHLKDGSIVDYPAGVSVVGQELRGNGHRYDAQLKPLGDVTVVPLDSVIGMESVRTRVNVPATVVVTTLVAVGSAVAFVAAMVAIFGSCPTVYSDDGAEEAELFSSSIAPLFEARDVDRLRAQADAQGTLRLDVRNEALETHYINHLQVLEIRHAADETVMPDPDGRPVAVRDTRPVAAPTDRVGRDLSVALRVADDDGYRADRRAVDAASAADLDDWIEMTAPVRAGATRVAVVLRLRNSLLSTQLLYDKMLGSSGARALDWLGSDLGQISTAVELGRWYQQHTGLHVQVWQSGGFSDVVRIPDAGPIAWHDVAAVVPVASGATSVRVRLRFLVDHWRIDRVGIAAEVRDAAPLALDIERVVNVLGRPDPGAREALRSPDDRYLQTTPGQRMTVEFEAGPLPEGQARTFLLSSQGYYTEWIRGEWMKRPAADPFVPTDDTLVSALKTWATTRDDFETRFRTARVPTR